jgi:hypothetical protein
LSNNAPVNPRFAQATSNSVDAEQDSNFQNLANTQLLLIGMIAELKKVEAEIDVLSRAERIEYIDVKRLYEKVQKMNHGIGYVR